MSSMTFDSVYGRHDFFQEDRGCNCGIPIMCGIPGVIFNVISLNMRNCHPLFDALSSSISHSPLEHMYDQSRGPPRYPQDNRYPQQHGSNQPQYGQQAQQPGFNQQQNPSHQHQQQYQHQPPQHAPPPQYNQYQPGYPPQYGNRNVPPQQPPQTAPAANVLFPTFPGTAAPPAGNPPHVISRGNILPDPVTALPPGIVSGPQGLQGTDGRPVRQVLPWIPSSNALGNQGQLAVALVCQSNNNRSVETHHVLSSNGYKFVFSYGIGAKVRMPGEKPNTPNVFDFGTPYMQMYHELRKRNQGLYTQNGCLAMLQRNAQVKAAPERFQDVNMKFDIIITFEKRVFDIVLEDLSKRNNPLVSCVHVINIETPDNHEDARNASYIALQLLNYVHSAIPNSVGEKPVSSALTASAIMNPILSHLPKPEGAQDHADMVIASESIYKAVEQLEAGMESPVSHTVVWY